PSRPLCLCLHIYSSNMGLYGHAHPGQIGMALHIGAHIGAAVDLDARWLSGDGLTSRHGQALLRLLEALSRSASLREAAQSAGQSYRHAWGLLAVGARVLGGPLIDMHRGRGAQLTPLGRKLVEADAHV